MATFLLHHSHGSEECAAALAAWRGFASPLRGQAADSSCLFGGHEVWWRVEADSREEALAQLPPFVAARTSVQAVRPVRVP